MKLIQGVIEPDKNKNFTWQIEDSFKKLKVWLSNNDLRLSQIVSINLYLNSASPENYYNRRKEFKEKLSETFSHPLPVAYLAQPPANNCELLLEIHALPSECYTNIEHKAIGDLKYLCVFDHNHTKYVFATGIEDSQTTEDILANSEHVFEKMETILNAENMSFSDILRQWNYIENIIDEGDTREGKKQSYQIFNDVRTKYYGKCIFQCGFPAATGIGTNAGGTIVSFYAVESSSDIVIRPIDNPLQVAAFNYTNDVLVGEPVNKGIGKTSPKFVRAKYVSGVNSETIFISGTAAIRGEESVALNDLASQTRITLENIEELIVPENLERNFVKPKKKNARITFLRGYIKNSGNYKLVMNICREKYPNIPIILVQSDICRVNLLVEIEGNVEFC
jgi:enamine deaminase RidA (YjgF/YER057c/UK114 family)